MYQEILSKLPSAVVFVADGQETIAYANAAAADLFPSMPIHGARLADLLASPEDRSSLQELIADGEGSRGLVFSPSTCGGGAGEGMRAMVTRSVVDGGATFFIQPCDVDADAVWRVVQYDSLTGLPNRELLRDRMEQGIRLARRLENAYLGVLFVDLDHFKPINDTFGHAAGDAVLVELARRLKMCLRESDTVARLGGDEFVVLLCNLRSTEDTAVVAERILDACARPFVVGESMFQISASLGVSIWPTDGKTVDELLQAADMAMYSSKAEGRNTLRFYDPQMNEKAKARATVESELRNALREGHFVLHYQPQFSVHSRGVIGAEALIRWHHPTRGVIPPSSFIRVAEETNLITPIGDWVLSEAVKQGRKWRDMGLTLRVAVNLSGRQFTDSLAERVSAVLTENDYPPQLLELELTESFLVADTDKAVRILRSLRSLGVRVALDDFGTGWSSLNYLKNFPVDTLKIDRSFIGASPGDFDARIVRAIIAIAREFNLETLAEGVETVEQLAKLQELGCNAWQGFLLSGAISAHDLTDFCRMTNLPLNCAAGQWGGK